MAGPMVLYSEWFLCIPYVLVMLILKHAILRITQLVQDSGWLLFLGALTLDNNGSAGSQFFPKNPTAKERKNQWGSIRCRHIIRWQHLFQIKAECYGYLKMPSFQWKRNMARDQCCPLQADWAPLERAGIEPVSSCSASDHSNHKTNTWQCCYLLFKRTLSVRLCCY